jgi:RHS repeat-associated protein
VNSVTETYAYDEADKLETVTVDSVVTKEFTYDAAGRTTAVETSAGTTSLAYDYEGRVTSITYPNTSSDSYSYNGLGARTSTSGTNGSRTFLRTGPGATHKVVEDGTHAYTSNVSSRDSSTTRFAHSGLKNTITQSAENETIAATSVRDAYGSEVTSSGSWQGIGSYGGSFGYQEDPSGLMLLAHRYYDPEMGRFLTSDPYGNGRNWYAYCEGNPVSQVDYDGLDPRGPPPVPVPGDLDNGWKWNPDPGNDRGGSWGPIKPLPGQGQPAASWDYKDGHWDVKDGRGNTDRYLINGKPISADYAHGGGRSNWRNSRWFKGARKIGKFGGKVFKLLIVVTLVMEGPDAAARDLVFKDEVDAIGGAITSHVDPWLDDKQEDVKDWYLARGGLTREDLDWEPQ